MWVLRTKLGSTEGQQGYELLNHHSLLYQTSIRAGKIMAKFMFKKKFRQFAIHKMEFILCTIFGCFLQLFSIYSNTEV